MDEQRGIYPKYHIERLTPNGLLDRSGKHDKCDYYVLDWKHDPFAIPAALAYADACESQFPVLAKELRDRAGAAAKART